MSKVEEHKVRFEVGEERLNHGSGAVHGGHDKRLQMERYVVGGLRAVGEAIDMWDINGDKCYELWVVVERHKVGLCLGWQEKGDLMASKG